MSDRCARYMGDGHGACILDAGHASPCQSAEVALAEALESMLEASELRDSGHAVESSHVESHARALLARVRGTR